MSERNKRGQIIVISGPSGVGKGTVIDGLRKRRDFGFSVSHTTRYMRPNEVDGVNYHYVTEEEFQALVDQGRMMETTLYNGYHYGTSWAAVNAVVETGQDILLDIEVEGGANVRKVCPEAVEIFLMPPSLKALEERLRGRGTETEEVIRDRMETAKREIPCAPYYDYIVVNRKDQLERTLDQIELILDSLSLRSSACGAMAQAVLDGGEV